MADLAERVERGCVAAGPGQGDHEGGPGALVQRLALGQPFQVRQVVVLVQPRGGIRVLQDGPDQVAGDLLTAQLPLPWARRRLAFAAVGSSSSGRNAADADDMLAGGFGRDQ